MASPTGEPRGHNTGVDDGDPVPTTSTRDIERWARRRFPQTTWTLRNVEIGTGRQRTEVSGAPSVMAPTIEQYARLAREYPEVADRLTAFALAPLDPGDERRPAALGRSTWNVETGERRLELSLELFSHPTRIGRRVRGAAGRGFHPSGTSQVESVVTHELGHHVWFLLEEEGFGPRGFTSSLAADRRSLSHYADGADDRDAETFAEAFVAHYLGDDGARNHPLTRSVVHFIERSMRWFRERRGTP